MYSISDIRTLHIELTDKCQAQCPMCARNYHGYGTRSFIKNKDVTLLEFKHWFPKEFLSQLSVFYSCGNYGDPAFASDCLEIYSYVRECNPMIKLGIHTNGGMRNTEWWEKLSKVIGKINDSYCTFAVDGFKGKHELYRRNTKFDKVIENLKAYISGGGRAIVDSLVFKHNEDDVEELEKFLIDLGVETVNFITTTRFYEMKQFSVLDNDKNIEYFLEPTSRLEFQKLINVSLEKLLDIEYRNQVVNDSSILPRCENEKGIYIDPSGNVYPCCLIGHDYIEDDVEEILPIHILHNISIQHTKKVFNKIGIPNCNNGVFKKNSVLFLNFDKTWDNKDKCLTCVNACSVSVHDKTKNV